MLSASERVDTGFETSLYTREAVSLAFSDETSALIDFILVFSFLFRSASSAECGETHDSHAILEHGPKRVRPSRQRSSA